MSVYFEVDGDELMDDEASPNNVEHLSWRQDPTSSLSDWTISISTNDDDDDDNSKTEATYHVHKTSLAVGPKTCIYFSTLFATPTGLAEKEDSTSRITLNEPDDAVVFPIMLDFLYSPAGALLAKTENALALRSLANYFRCRALMTKVNEFIQMDLSEDTVVQYLCMASERNDDKVEAAARLFIVENYNDVASDQLVSLPTDLFRSIVACSPQMESTCHDRIGFDVNEFFRANPELLSASLLKELTEHIDESDVRSTENTIGLRNLIAKLAPPDQDDEEQRSAWLALDKQCQVTAAALANDWESIDTTKCMADFCDPKTKGDYRGSGRLVITRLSAALEQAKIDIKTDRSKHWSIKRKRKKEGP